jgi:NADH-ubiquinone oxidoreductase chain 2
MNMDEEFYSSGIELYGGLLWINNYILFFNIFIFIVTIFILNINSFHPRKFNLKSANTLNSIDKMKKHQMIIEYSLIILFCVTGGVFLISSSDIISIFLSIELQSYALYLLCSIYRDSENSVSAGLTYFLLGGLSSCIILLGQSLLYLNTGNTSLENVYIIKSIYDSLFYNNQIMLINNENILYYWNSIQYSLTILSVGFLFKVSSAPFHFWSPDVYDAIPTIVTTFVAIIAKISILVFLLEIIYYTSSSFTQVSWVNNITISSVLSLIIGSVLGLTQYRIKRLYAYSTISHIGFILLALAINSYDSIESFFFYIIQYSISNLNAFMILIAIGYSLYFYEWQDKTIKYRVLKDVNNSPIQLISQLKGYFYTNPILAISLAITLFSFVGVPPLIGFFGKQMILSSALQAGFIFITFIAILTSVISAVYYLWIVKLIFFDNKIYNNVYALSLGSYLPFVISLITLTLMTYILFANDSMLLHLA